MKALRRLSTTLFLLCLAGMAMAQDVIVMKDQTTVMSKVLEISSTEIKYKKWDNQDGPTYSVLRSEVVSINYQNGEVESFTGTTNNQSSQQNINPQQVQDYNYYMTHKGTSLYLNCRLLSDIEVQKLVDPQSYQLYLKAGNKETTGFLLDLGGGALCITAGLIELIATDAYDYHSASFKKALACMIVGCSLGITAMILESSASNNVGKIADTYNNKHGNSYSLNIAPSLMQYDIPQSQGNCGLGLTLSMNF